MALFTQSLINLPNLYFVWNSVHGDSQLDYFYHLVEQLSTSVSAPCTAEQLVCLRRYGQGPLVLLDNNVGLPAHF